MDYYDENLVFHFFLIKKYLSIKNVENLFDVIWVLPSRILNSSGNSLNVNYYQKTEVLSGI